MAALLAVLAIWVVRSLAAGDQAVGRQQREARSATSDGSIFSFPHLWLGVLCLFVYVGVEVMAGDAIGTYGAGFHLPLGETALLHHLHPVRDAARLRRRACCSIPRFVSQQRYLAISAVLGVLFTIGAYLTHGYVSVGFVAALGFANAMMWPAIFPLAINGLGRHHRSGFGAADHGHRRRRDHAADCSPHLKQHIDFQLVFALLMIPCYLYILYYGAGAATAWARRTTRLNAEPMRYALGCVGAARLARHDRRRAIAAPDIARCTRSERCVAPRSRMSPNVPASR